MLGWSDEQDVDNYGNLYNNPINTGNYGNDSIHSHKGTLLVLDNDRS